MSELPELYGYLPHRPPMLLVDALTRLESNYSETTITINQDAAFFVKDKGVPSWIGIEYMGQTAAAIAGFQLHVGTLEPHVGLLLGTRKYTADVEWFAPGIELRVCCKELGVMQGVATFSCEISTTTAAGQTTLAKANLTVYRRPMDSQRET